MDVRCNRCGTEYEFDDALVSERGTTVKCTNCGHQFKVYPGGNRAGLPERWIVRKASGRELIYTSLKDLQRAIAQRHVGPSDMLSRGEGAPMRALGGIAELEPFFRLQNAAAPQALPRTLVGMSPPNTSGAQPPEEDTIPDQAPPTASQNAEFGATMPSAQRKRTPAGGIAAAPVKTQVVEQRLAGMERYTEPSTSETTAVGTPYSLHEQATAPESIYDAKTVVASVEAPPTQPVPISPPTTPKAADQRAAAPTEPAPREPMPSVDEHDAHGFYPATPGVPHRSPVPWIFAALAIGVVVLGGTLGRKYISQTLANKETSAATQSDARVTEMLRSAGELFNRGDLEGAKEQLDKATVLADRDANVRSALARLEAARADTHWLAIKLIGTTDEAAQKAEQRQLDERLERVRRSAEQAAALAPNDPAVLRARIDAYRIGGELPKARELVGSLAASASEPETAYVLAALDIAEASPEWSTVIDRLRTAEGVEGPLSRARAALIYALVSSGQVGEAKTKLAKIPPSHPLTERLRAFVEKALGTIGDAGAAAALPSASAAASGAPLAAGAPGSPAPGPAGMDFRKLLEEASRAKQAGDLARAQQFYEAARSKEPGNIEALAGLGDVAKARGDNAGAARYYDSVLASNPSYLPTLIARADQKWAAGDHGGAVTLYRKALQQAGPGTAYGQRAAARIQEHESATGAKPAAPEPIPTEPAPSKPSAPAPTSENPGIDTSDLPGFSK